MNKKVYVDIVRTKPNTKCDICGAPAVITYQCETDSGHADTIALCDECEDERIESNRIS